MTARPIVVRSGEGLDVSLGRIILPGEDTDGRVSVIEMRARPGVIVPDHIHRDAEELCFRLD